MKSLQGMTSNNAHSLCAKTSRTSNIPCAQNSYFMFASLPILGV